jgi:hypothetical protein
MDVSDFLSSYKTGRGIQYGFAFFTLANTYLAVMHFHKHDWFGMACDLSIIALMLFLMRSMKKTLIMKKELDAKIAEMYKKHGIER